MKCHYWLYFTGTITKLFHFLQGQSCLLQLLGYFRLHCLCFFGHLATEEQETLRAFHSTDRDRSTSRRWIQSFYGVYYFYFWILLGFRVLSTASSGYLVMEQISPCWDATLSSFSSVLMTTKDWNYFLSHWTVQALYLAVQHLTAGCFILADKKMCVRSSIHFYRQMGRKVSKVF